jgi:pimeloyl-ACP methyl ester carboxylesterase
MIRRAYVDGPFGQLHLRQCGEGGAPLLLLHQSPLSGAQFDPALPLLGRRGFHAVALDTPGYGGSAVPPEPCGIAGYADAALAAIDALGWSSAHVLGHHTGAMIAANLAVRAPQRVRRLVLNGVPLLSAGEREHFAQFRFDPIVPAADGSHLIEAWQQRLASTPGWTDLEAMHRHTIELLANPVHYGRGFAAAFAHDHSADLERVTQPTLILTNTGEDLLDASRRAHALRPDFAFAALEGGTHDIVDEQPEAWADAVVGWLRG